MSGALARVISRMGGHDPGALAGSVERAAWIGGLWVPAWVLYLREPSWMTVLAGCFCMVSVGRSLKGYGGEAGADLSGMALKGVSGAPIYFDDSRALFRVILPSLAIAGLAEAAAVAMILERYGIASVLVGGCVAALMWRFGAKASVQGKEARSRKGLSLGLAFLFTVVALLPYLRSVRFEAWGEALMAKKAVGGRPRETMKEQPTTSNDGYSGIILIPSTEPKKQIIAPRSKDAANARFRRREPMVIPFDGAYWYFKAPDKRPRPTTRLVRGSSTKATIRSSDLYPLLMEAHQRLGTRVDLSCCSSVEIAVQNADRRPGEIALELWLMDSAAHRGMGR